MTMTRLLAAATVWFALGPVLAQVTPPATDVRQVHWQRSLDDALAECRATGRPLLIAVNMDGESASDRIVHEEYVDPEFVALTRHCVCLGASVFRHNARDHDDDGRRIPCPRFGGITCGEHMALEPLLYERYLSDGERVAPRHALVRADGSKAFDLSLCFDLRDIDRALAAAVPESPAGAATPTPTPAADWLTLAARRDAAGRTALEAAIASTMARPHDTATLLAALQAIEAHGDAGSLEALQLVVAGMPDPGDRALPALRAAATKVGGADAAFQLFRRLADTLGAVPGAARGTARQRSATLWTQLTYGPVPNAPDVLAFALGHLATNDWLIPTHDDEFLDAWRHHPGVDIEALLTTAAATTRAGRDLPLPNPIADEPLAAEVLERQLDDLDRADPTTRDTADWCARFAKASLDLARRRLESGGRDAQPLFEDAEMFFERALVRRADCCEWWIERARAAYFRQRFADQVAFGMRAYALAVGRDAAPLPRDSVVGLDHGLFGGTLDGRAVEALRWIGDGHARLLGAADATPLDGLVHRIDGLRALGAVVAGPFGSDKDWLTLASFCAAIGRPVLAATVAACGVDRFPTSRELRQEWNAALWRCGRIDFAPALADRVQRQHPSADAAWHAGYAHVLAAEDARRRERPQLATMLYVAAEQRFDDAVLQNPEYAASCQAMTALALLGRAMASLQDDDRTGAAELLVRAVTAQPDLAAAKDGLGCDVFDVVDRILEWRASGPSPVDPARLLGSLPQTPFYAAAVSDALLREALRADGRNPVRKERRTVDAAGNPITMPLGMPNDEGDRFLLAAIEAGRVAAAHAASRDDKLPLAQSLTIWAERGFERGHPKGVREALTEAAPLLELPPPTAAADDDALRALTARLRELLGEARPRLREGR